jgi:hypothetical protein
MGFELRQVGSKLESRHCSAAAQQDWPTPKDSAGVPSGPSMPIAWRCLNCDNNRRVRMKNFERITVDPAQMGGVPCVRLYEYLLLPCCDCWLAA